MAVKPRLAKDEYPCAVPGCPAVTTRVGGKCAVHKAWNPGPHKDPCVLCHQPITKDELWNYRNNDFATPVHAACVNRKSKPPKSSPRQPRLL